MKGIRLMDLIDVTLRESVYYESGIDYGKALRYLRKEAELISNQDIQYVEIGYLNNHEEGNLNYNADYINEAQAICEGKFKLVSIMHPHLANKKLWSKKTISQLALVRIVTGGEVSETIRDYIAYFHELGVEVSVNIIYAASLDMDQIRNSLEKSQEYGADFFYCADSSGSFTPRMIEAIGSDLKRYGTSVKLGFHLHDHYQMSTANALMARDCGLDITDVSITGAGKGGGNLRAELIIPILRCMYGGTIRAEELCALYDLILFFNNLIDRNGNHYERVFLDSLTGLYKTELKRLEQIVSLAGEDAHRYIRLITGEENFGQIDNLF